jgi:hypothetical protein
MVSVVGSDENRPGTKNGLRMLVLHDDDQARGEMA